MDMKQKREELISFLDSIARPGSGVDKIEDDDQNLVQSGVVDSFALIQIIFYLEQTHGLNLQKLGIDPADLVSISGVLAAIRKSQD